jgi:Protein of unknown function (DUF962)
MTFDRDEMGLLRWQWALYPLAHRDRRNLLVHALTAPILIAATLTIVVSAIKLAWVPLVVGLAAFIGVMLAQKRGHALEASAPATFRGPMDVVVRIFVEQWVTFPRYVLSGSFARAWRGGASQRSNASS